MAAGRCRRSVGAPAAAAPGSAGEAAGADRVGGGGEWRRPPGRVNRGCSPGCPHHTSATPNGGLARPAGVAGGGGGGRGNLRVLPPPSPPKSPGAPEPLGPHTRPHCVAPFAGSRCPSAADSVPPPLPLESRCLLMQKTAPGLTSGRSPPDPPYPGPRPRGGKRLWGGSAARFGPVAVLAG